MTRAGLLVAAFLGCFLSTAALARGADASLEDVSWIVGAWQGEGLGGFVEEVWTPAKGGAMMGSFRLVVDGNVSFYELMTLVEHDGGLELRLKHFNGDLTAWEDKEDKVIFGFESVEPGVLRLKGLAFHRVDDERMRIELRLRGKDGNVRTELFHFNRVRLGER